MYKRFSGRVVQDDESPRDLAVSIPSAPYIEKVPFLLLAGPGVRVGRSGRLGSGCEAPFLHPTCPGSRGLNSTGICGRHRGSFASSSSFATTSSFATSATSLASTTSTTLSHEDSFSGIHCAIEEERASEALGECKDAQHQKDSGNHGLWARSELKIELKSEVSVATT